MITPGLLRRSLLRAAQWRLLVLFAVIMAIPSAIATLPFLGFLRRNLDLHPRAAEWAKVLDSAAIFDLLKQFGAQESALPIQTGLASAGLLMLFIAPFLAGLGLAAARSDDTLDFRALLSGAAAHYGRLLRFVPFSLIPIGLFLFPGMMMMRMAGKTSEKAITEAAANAAGNRATIVFFICLLVGQTIADSGRALFGAEPHRRSAFFAAFAGIRLFFRRPLRALAIGATTWILALVLAAGFLWLRLRIPQPGMGMALAFVFAQLAIAALAWGRTSRLVALTELARADAAARIAKLGSSRVDLQACKLEYSIVSPK